MCVRNVRAAAWPIDGNTQSNLHRSQICMYDFSIFNVSIYLRTCARVWIFIHIHRVHMCTSLYLEKSGWLATSRGPFFPLLLRLVITVSIISQVHRIQPCIWFLKYPGIGEHEKAVVKNSRNVLEVEIQFFTMGSTFLIACRPFFDAARTRNIVLFSVRKKTWQWLDGMCNLSIHDKWLFIKEKEWQRFSVAMTILLDALFFCD